MPQFVEQLLPLLQLEKIADLHYLGKQPKSILQRAFGGQVLAQALAAAYQTVSDDRMAHSVTGNFLLPGDISKPIHYFVLPTRDGGSFSTRRVTAKQDEKVIFSFVASFKTFETGLTHSDPYPYGVRPPESCPPLAEILAGRSQGALARWQEEWGVLDARYAGDSAHDGMGTDHAGRMQVWIRTEGKLPNDPIIHQLALAYLSDLTILAATTVPHPVDFGGQDMLVATLSHSMWFHRPCFADQWLLYDQVTPNAANGMGFSFGRLFQNDLIVASVAQEGLIRLRAENSEKPRAGAYG